MRAIAMISLLALAACGGGGPGANPGGLSERAQALAFGAKAGQAPANGLPFATEEMTLADVDGAGPISIKVVGAITDHESGETRLVILDETVISTGDDLGDFVVTLNGETLAFVEGAGPASVEGGEDWNSETFTEGAVSATRSIYVYARGGNPDLNGEFDAELFSVVGFETDPAEIAAIMGSVTYSGILEGYGQLLDLDGNLIDDEVNISGGIEITAAFDDLDTVNGSLNASYGADEGSDFENTVEMTFSAGIDGNGYAADLNCTSGCVDQSSVIAGAFYGHDALETSGLIGFDITSTVANPGDPNAPFETQFIGGSGFTATQDGVVGGDGGEG